MGLGQPFIGQQVVVIERRFPDGSLDLKGEQPPAWTIPGLTFDDVYHKLFWADSHNADKAGSWDNLKAWLDSMGWSLRRKYW